MKERTYELTNFCSHKCEFCSSDATDDPDKATWMDLDTFHRDLEKHGPFDTIYLSGGEPVAHPQFYWFLSAAKHFTQNVVVYTNALRHIVYNARVIDGVTVDANLTLGADTQSLHVLKRVSQGREARRLHGRPTVRLSSNFDHEGAVCDPPCSHVVIRPDGSKGKPCKKEACADESLEEPR